MNCWLNSSDVERKFNSAPRAGEWKLRFGDKHAVMTLRASDTSFPARWTNWAVSGSVCGSSTHTGQSHLPCCSLAVRFKDETHTQKILVKGRGLSPWKDPQRNQCSSSTDSKQESFTLFCLLFSELKLLCRGVARCYDDALKGNGL